MAVGQYRLILELRTTGSDAGTTPQTWTVTADTPADAVKLAKLYIAVIPGKLLRAATLAEMMGKVIWRKEDWRQERSEPTQRHGGGSA